VVMLVAGLLGLVALFVLDRLPRPLLNLRVIAPLAELSRGSRRLFAKPARCGVVLGLSALTIGLTILAFKLAADGIGSRLSFGSWLAIVPPVTLLQLLPISLAGWGMREVVLVVVLASFGVPAEAALATSVLGFLPDCHRPPRRPFGSLTGKSRRGLFLQLLRFGSRIGSNVGAGQHNLANDPSRTAVAPNHTKPRIGHRF
jgi:lysylphosphatidylglycerol synthase-like protein